MIRFDLKERGGARRERTPPPRESWLSRTSLRLMEVLLFAVVRRYQQNAMSFVKIQATTYYVKAISKARMAVVGTIAFFGVMLMLLGGFLIMHIGFFTFFNWSNRAKGAVLFILGLIYFGIALGAVLYATRQRSWMKYSGASQMVQNVTRESRDATAKG